MKAILAALLLLLLLPSPAAATSAEATVLSAAMGSMATVAQGLTAGTLTTTQAAAAALVIRDGDVGQVAEYSTACAPFAIYVRTTADMFAQTLGVLAEDEHAMANGYALIVSALFAYSTMPGGRLPGFMSGCEAGL